jgi:demethylmenaquinone methyltransferase/2-methoxy-6-polyprenyl-1,4-benzoquinol methylase
MNTPATLASGSPRPSKPETIQQMFGAIASRYDLANTVLSLGIHHYWRRVLIARSSVSKGMHVFDAATGTGDLALLFAPMVGPQGKVIGGDFSEPMLDQARRKAHARNYPWLHFQFADVMQLPFEDSSFDVVSIAFGIRNVADPVAGLTELHRVLKPGGTLLVLEFGSGTSGIWGLLYRFYTGRILPFLGGLVTGQRGAYRYLEQSSAEFPSRENFVALMNLVGCPGTAEVHQQPDSQTSSQRVVGPWSAIEWQGLTFGSAFLYSATKA